MSCTDHLQINTGEMDKVFHSEITRSQNRHNNDLFDLLKVVPAKPIPLGIKKCHDCDFEPKNDKQYIPKKKSKLKVKTVRDIRSDYEKDVLSDLPNELEKQQNILLRKIRLGSSRDDNTKTLARNILNGEKPISRSSLQMLMNINPEGHTHSSQFVLWDGKLVRVNGSKGGRNKFLCNHDLKKKIREPVMNKNIFKKKPSLKKRCLLQNSLSINFKPGPLTRKKFLDDSYQKFNVGDIELVNLPKPGLEIQPSYGCSIDPSVTNILYNFREVDGIISQKWAEFAASVVGAVTSSSISPSDNNCSVTFDLSYKCNQRRILMRRDLDINHKILENDDISSSYKTLVDDTTDVIKVIIEKLVDAVEINLCQDNMYTGIDEPRVTDGSESSNANNFSKDKAKRRYCELDRLDVTVIRLSENQAVNDLNACRNSFCSLGCICSSLKCDVNLKTHCGRIDCMFECKCDFSKYRVVDSFDSDYPDLLPGILNLDSEINFNLAKEEQKFHQTVVVSGDKSILLKSKRRNWKSSKKYAEFYSNMCLKSEIKVKPVLKIIETKLNCENVEPWCMVHNLYKCFCKGKFVEMSANEKVGKELLSTAPPLSEILIDDNSDELKKEKLTSKSKYEMRKTSESKARKLREISSDKSETELNYLIEKYDDGRSHTCARARKYDGRKFSQGYYLNAAYKIQNMEVNDDNLCKRLTYLINKSSGRIKNTEKKVDPTNDAEIYSTTQKEKQSKIASEKELSAFLCEKQNSIYLIDESSNSNESQTQNKEKVPKRNKDKYYFEDVSSSGEREKSNKIKNSNYKQDDPKRKTDDCRDSSKLEMIESTAENRITNKPKLVAWLESSYQQYRKRIHLGINKSSLEPPKKGKVALYPWNFILSRYNQRKNLFLVSKQKPFRIFMAVDVKHPMFDSCINISEILPEDFEKYPLTVRNLLKNKNDLNEYFCILFGLNHCWELIGSVTKVNDSKIKDSHASFSGEFTDVEQSKNNVSNSESVDDSSINDSFPITDNSEIPDDSSIIDNSKLSNDSAIIDDSPIIDNAKVDNQITDDMIIDNQDKEITPKADSSKWFVMTVENDFTEIQFYNRGFFVKYESIIKAINVARTTGKTVRLSSQKCADKSSCPQFGIYAIPNAYEYCVFVGPYEINEQLGIETVKTMFANKKHKRTRGIWITTDKVDNLKVIDNPLSFMPTQIIDYNEMVPIENDVPLSNKTVDNKSINKSCTLKEPNTQITVKEPIKPIRIRKANGFYQLASSPGKKTVSIFKSLPSRWTSIPTGRTLIKPSVSNASDIVKFRCITKSQNQDSELNSSSLPMMAMISCDESKVQKKPVAEVAPQIKIAAVYSEAPLEKQKIPKKPEGGMFVLKPEEINKRIVENKIFPELESSQSKNVTEDTEMAMDIEDFLHKSTALDTSEAFVISDDDDEMLDEIYKEVWIECETVENLGLIKGRTNKEGLLSFEFPGFKFTEFYEKNVAFDKIIQVLSRRIYIPKNLELKWSVNEVPDSVKTFRLLKNDDLGPDFVLTKKGIRHKNDVARYSKTYSRKRLPPEETCDVKEILSPGWEKKSKKLEDETHTLWNNTITKKDEIAKSIAEASEEDRIQLTDDLKDIMSLAED